MKPVPDPTLSTPAADNVSLSFNARKGMALMALAMLILPMMDGLSKLLSTTYDVTPGQITFGRFLVQACLLGPVVLWSAGLRNLGARTWAINLLRGAIMGVAVLLFFTTLRYMPIADAIAVFFIEPFILTIFSVIFLKEKVGWKRALAVIFGFGGAMLIVQPSYEVFGLVSLLPVGTAILFATYLLITRKFGTEADPVTMQFLAGIGGTCILFGAMMLGNSAGIDDIANPGLPEFGIRWGLIFAIGALAAFGHLVVVHAFRLANASLLAPFQYIEIVGAVLLGYLMFGDFPDALKWLGIAIIIASGLYLFFREQKSGGEQS